MAFDLESKQSVNGCKYKSIKGIIDELFVNDNTSSPIASWLINVIDTYLQHTQKLEPLTVDKLFTLTNDMLLTYSIASNQDESMQLCSKLFVSLQANKHLPKIEETYPIYTKCNALFLEDNEWYPATVIEIIQPGQSYIIQFDGYENQQNANIHQLKHLDTPKQRNSVSLKDSIDTSIDKDLHNLIMSDLVDDGIKKKKYKNELMELHEVDEEKLNLAINDDDVHNFELFMTETEKDDKNEMDENNVEKYTVIVDGKKRRINPSNDVCCICQRLAPLTWHHLIPKCTHNEYLKTHKDATKMFVNTWGIWICRSCHSAIHGMYTNKELMKSFWKLEMLMESPKVQKWVSYVSRKRVRSKSDKRTIKQNRVANIQRDKTDHSTKIRYVK